MKAFFKLLTILALAVASWIPSAAQANQCISPGTWVDARDGFCFTFRIDSDGSNRVRLEKSFYYPLWTDDRRFRFYNPAFYERRYVNERKERIFRVRFVRTSNRNARWIKGTLTYYIDGVLQQTINNFHLSAATGVDKFSPSLRLNLVGGEFDDANDYCITSGNCSDLPLTEIDICSYVPDGLQTNRYTSSSPKRAHGAMFISGSNNKIYPQSNDPKYSFQTISQPNNTCVFPSGSTGSCSFDASKIHNTLPMPTPNFSHGNNDLTCDENRTCNLNSGRHKDIIIKENAKLRLTGGEYWLNELKFAEEDAQLEVLAPSIVHYKKIHFEKPGVRINQGGNSHDLLFVGHDEDAEIEMEDGDSVNYRINAFFYIDPDSDDGFRIEGDDIELRGGITAQSISISGRNNKIYPLNCNSQPTPEVSSIVIKPFNYHLTCETTPNNIVEVHMLDSNGAPVAGLTPTLVQENGSNLNITYLSEANGVAKFRVTTNTDSSIVNYDLKASLTTGGQTFTDTDQIKYVPYKFEVADKYLVAGKNEQVTVNVKACSNSGQLITLGYTGSPTATFNYQKPTSATVVSGDLSFSANLTNSNRQADINFKESGQIRVTITDNSFVCNDVRCPVEGGALKGQFDVYSRPWKIAICDVKETGGSNKANPATTTGSPGFVPGGTGFSATYKPIVHSDSNGGVSDECNYPLTGNYSLDNGPLNLAYSVSYPTTNPQIGTVTPSVIPNFSSGSETQTINHSWTEVGTLSLQTSASYLTMSVDPDAQNVGRFYPDFFKIDENAWNDPLVGGGPQRQAFTYMNQIFSSVTAKVGAYNVQGTATSNYAAFSSSLKAVFQFDNRDRLTNADTTALATKSSYQSNQWVLDSDQIAWNKKANFTPDGPYNYLSGNALNVSLEVLPSTVNDPVRFKSSASDINPSSTQVLPDEQPRLVFGRYNLADVGGVQGEPITVPLQAQYWNGSSFQTNTSDSFSTFDGTHHCSNIIWPSVGAINGNITLNKSGTVSSGDSRTLEARQTTSTREQVQLWLRLDNSSPSANCSGTNNGQTWMMYDWNQNGTDEENPSTVVTFGIFRGNDRVIFRGESGLTGQ
ncbi:DUF6701 domain-containing protein [Vibrio tubiashii]|uniref:DUF6701 domain-containing protein n=1 Tax=Vibrio tubiashii TaxID=29498 RepID=UPI00349E6F8F